jgi:transcriptional regulator with XRE-family HTH domain
VPKDALHRHLSTRVREIAGRKKVSLNRLADLAGISRSHLARILRGESSPSLAVIGRIADALEVGVRELLPPS